MVYTQQSTRYIYIITIYIYFTYVKSYSILIYKRKPYYSIHFIEILLSTYASFHHIYITECSAFPAYLLCARVSSYCIAWYTYLYMVYYILFSVSARSSTCVLCSSLNFPRKFCFQVPITVSIMLRSSAKFCMDFHICGRISITVGKKKKIVFVLSKFRWRLYKYRKLMEILF